MRKRRNAKNEGMKANEIERKKGELHRLSVGRRTCRERWPVDVDDVPGSR